MPNDNRMGWIRNLEALAGEVPTYTAEYELGSECSLTGLLDYGDGRIICAPMGTEKSRDGLWLYNLVVSFPLGAQDESPEDRLRRLSEAEAKGYYFQDGILGELLALLSLFHRCRFFLISSRLPPGNPRTGMTIKTEYPYIRVACDPGIHPPVFQGADKNLAVRFAEFLNELKTLDEERHQDFVLACYHYRRAINEIGVDPEMVFIRLVSAIETLARDTKLTNEEDCLEDKDIAELIAQSNLSPDLKGELKNTFDVRKARKRFIRFMVQHSGGFFEKSDAQQSQLKIKEADLERVLDTIYRARSRYLHSGEPMYLSRPMRGGENWDTDPSLGMIADNRHIPGSEKLPYSYFFEGLAACRTGTFS